MRIELEMALGAWRAINRLWFLMLLQACSSFLFEHDDSLVLFTPGMALPGCCVLRETAQCLCVRTYYVVPDAPAWSVIHTPRHAVLFVTCIVLGRSTFLTEKQVDPACYRLRLAELS